MRRLLTALLVLLAAPSAAAAATWSAPATVSAPRTFEGPLLLAVRGDGALTTAWTWQDNVGNDAFGGWSTATRTAGAAAFGAESDTVDGLLALKPFAHAQTIALGTQAVPHDPLRARIIAGVGASTPRTLTTARLFRQPALGASADGRSALIAYVEVVNPGRRIVRTIDRRNGAWAAPSTISGQGRANYVTAAVGPRGDAVVAFVRDGSLYARVRRPGHNWGSIRKVKTGDANTTWSLGAAVSAAGQVRLVWRRHPYRGVTALETTAMLAGRGTFNAPQTLAADGAAADLALTATTTGWAIADVEASRPTLHLVAGSRLGAPVAAAPAQGGARGAALATDADGSLTLAWIQPLTGQGSDGVARGATLAPGAAAFGPVEDVSPPETVHEVRLAPGPTALWIARPTNAPPSLVRTATRTP